MFANIHLAKTYASIFLNYQHRGFEEKVYNALARLSGKITAVAGSGCGDVTGVGLKHDAIECFAGRVECFVWTRGFMHSCNMFTLDL